MRKGSESVTGLVIRLCYTFTESQISATHIFKTDSCGPFLTAESLGSLIQCEGGTEGNQRLLGMSPVTFSDEISHMLKHFVYLFGSDRFTVFTCFQFT